MPFFLPSSHYPPILEQAHPLTTAVEPPQGGVRECAALDMEASARNTGGSNLAYSSSTSQGFAKTLRKNPLVQPPKNWRTDVGGRFMGIPSYQSPYSGENLTMGLVCI